MLHWIASTARAAVAAMDNLYRTGQMAGSRKLCYSLDHHSTAASAAVYIASVFQLFQANGVDPDEFSISKALTVAANFGAMPEGRKLHALIVKRNLPMDVAATNSLINFYCKCGSIVDARNVFDEMPERDVFSWTVLVSGYALKGRVAEALDLFQSMPRRNIVSWNAIITGHQRGGFDDKAIELFVGMMREGESPNYLTFLAVIKAYTARQLLLGGKGVHCFVVKSAWVQDVLVGSTVVDMYAKCGDMLDAQEAFNEIPEKNAISWSILLTGFAQNGMMVEAERIFCELPVKSVIVWNVLIVGFVQNGVQHRAFGFLVEMFKNGVYPNSCTLTSLLSGCSSLQYRKEGKIVHSIALKLGLESDTSVCNSMITMYGEQGNIDDARHIFNTMNRHDIITWTAMLSAHVANYDVKQACDIFNRMPDKNLISWNTMMFGYLQEMRNSTCFDDEAIKFFYGMERSEVKPDHFSYNCALTACSCVGALDQAMAIHCRALRRGFESDIGVGNALITTYGKCGSLQEAEVVFKNISKPDMISWNTMLSAYSQNGQGKKALDFYDEMRRSRVELNHLTFISLLSACSYTGEVKRGQEYFHIMEKDYGMIPTKEHFTCMVDLLGRAGFLSEAEAVIRAMPIQPDAAVWGALLGACKIHNDPIIGSKAAEEIFMLEPDNSAAHVAVAETFAAKFMWEDVEKVRIAMKEKGLMKEPGCSWIDIKNVKHMFLSGDNSHLQKDSIYESLYQLYSNMIEEDNKNTNFGLFWLIVRLVFVFHY
ncbi:Pentatricopeptide repeat-containing protein [Apostasia shenzhenica]|uniref:Pentatricopeptide repeat-containing protein n=1 Tax=Apostasia shenzhenica TaxID=1088818 RepID=A0A2H9ZZN0_9ASPA|nr:Pentatricopeptide repeat-containing protein [Apostasia shenzhenica]